MTDLERVREIVQENCVLDSEHGDLTADGYEADRIIDSHLEKDAEREKRQDLARVEIGRLQDRNQELETQRDALYAMREAWIADGPSESETRAMLHEQLKLSRKQQAELAELREDLKYREDQYEGLAIRFDELREAVRREAETFDRIAEGRAGEGVHQAARLGAHRLRQLIEEKP